MKKILKIIFLIIIILLLIIIFWGIIRPAYIDYKLNKKTVEVDKSGELAVSKNKKPNDSDSYKLEKKEYEPFICDDRILVYEGKISSSFMNELIDILIEDIDSELYSKPDIHFENVNNLSSYDILYEDKNNYILVLNQFKNNILYDSSYEVSFEYNKTKTIVNKIIIKKL